VVDVGFEAVHALGVEAEESVDETAETGAHEVADLDVARELAGDAGSVALHTREVVGCEFVGEWDTL
jgi:hypothetical protein